MEPEPEPWHALPVNLPPGQTLAVETLQLELVMESDRGWSLGASDAAAAAMLGRAAPRR